MRWSATLGEWNRRKSTLTAFGAAAAALFALAVPMHLQWLIWAGVVAAVVAVAGVVVSTKEARLERERERVELDRRVRVPVALISKVDPTEIGVDRAAQEALPGATLPDYVHRDADTKLRDSIAAALTGRDKWLVVVEGPSKVGKSRTLFEALRSYAIAEDIPLLLVAPVDGDALRSLLDPGQAPVIRAEYVVLWLDDLEPFLNQGVTLQTLREWRSSRSGRIVVATYGGKGSEKIGGAAIPGLTTIAADVLQHAREIPLPKTTATELEPLRGQLKAEFDAVCRHGLAAYLVAGDALQRKLTTARHSPGEPPCPHGVAVVYTAVDWARCGRTDPIGEATLRQLWATHPHTGLTFDDVDFDTGLTWALRPVAGTIALLHRTDGYQAYDYVIRLVGEQSGVAPPPDPVWAAAIATAYPTQALVVATTAYAHLRLTDAATAFTRARESSIDELAALAGYDLGVVLAELGCTTDALAAYRRVITDYRDDPTPAVRKQVADALINTGNMLGGLGRTTDALAAYQQVITDYRDDPTPARREQVAAALFNTAATLAGLGRTADSLAAYQQVITDYRDDPAPALRERVAKALFNTGVTLAELGRTADALAAYQHLITDYRDDPAPALREQVGNALYNKGITLAGLGHTTDELAAYQQLITDYPDDPAPALRERVAKALFNTGVTLAELGRTADALAAYQHLITDYRDDPAPALREQVAMARVNTAATLCALGRTADALAAYRQVITDHRDDLAPALREAARRAAAALREAEDAGSSA